MGDSRSIRAMILAAGLGSRLRPLTNTTPKPLVEVNGRPLIDYALDTVRKAGIRDVVLNVHHLADQIRNYLGDGSEQDLRIQYSEEAELLDTGGGILHARSLLGDGDFVTLNSDTIMDIDLAAMLQQHRRTNAIGTLALRKDPRMEEFGIVAMDSECRIGQLLQHRRPDIREDDLEPFMYTGLQILNTRIFDFMPTEPSVFSITRCTYPGMLAQRQPLYGYRFDGTWITVGTPDELTAAEKILGAR